MAKGRTLVAERLAERMGHVPIGRGRHRTRRGDPGTDYKGSDERCFGIFFKALAVHFGLTLHRSLFIEREKVAHSSPMPRSWTLAVPSSSPSLRIGPLFPFPFEP